MKLLYFKMCVVGQGKVNIDTTFDQSLKAFHLFSLNYEFPLNS